MKVRREEESKSKEARKRSNASNFQGNLCELTGCKSEKMDYVCTDTSLYSVFSKVLPN